MVKFQIGQFKSLKQIFFKFVGKFDLEGQGQIHSSSMKVNSHGSKVVALQVITQNCLVSMPI